MGDGYWPLSIPQRNQWFLLNLGVAPFAGVIGSLLRAPILAGPAVHARPCFANAPLFLVRARISTGSSILPRASSDARPLLIAAHRDLSAGCRDSYRELKSNLFCGYWPVLILTVADFEILPHCNQKSHYLMCKCNSSV